MPADRPIIIYQMGKVGSTALFQSLIKNQKDVFQIHSLNQDKLTNTRAVLTRKGMGIPKHVKLSGRLIQRHLLHAQPVYIISPIRSPFERNISAFFQELSTEIILKDELRKNLGISQHISKITRIPAPNEWKNALIDRWIHKIIADKVDVLIDHFIANYRHGLPLDWFDNELYPSLGIDVFAEKPEHTFNYKIFNKEHIKLLVIKSELPDNEKGKIISAFLDQFNIQIVRSHESHHKIYEHAISAFRSRIEISPKLHKIYFNSKYVRYFYPELTR
jgi:hypothetical protein